MGKVLALHLHMKLMSFLTGGNYVRPFGNATSISTRWFLSL